MASNYFQRVDDTKDQLAALERTGAGAAASGKDAITSRLEDLRTDMSLQPGMRSGDMLMKQAEDLGAVGVLHGTFKGLAIARESEGMLGRGIQKLGFGQGKGLRMRNANRGITEAKGRQAAAKAAVDDTSADETLGEKRLRLAADPANESRSIAPTTKYSATDVQPNELYGGGGRALRTSNTARLGALDDADKTKVAQAAANDDAYDATNADSARSQFALQEHIGDVEEGNRAAAEAGIRADPDMQMQFGQEGDAVQNQIAAARQEPGGAGGAGGNFDPNVDPNAARIGTNQAGDDAIARLGPKRGPLSTRGAVDADTGLLPGEDASLGTRTGVLAGATEDVAAATAAGTDAAAYTAADIAMDAIPGIGELAGAIFGIVEAVHSPLQQNKKLLQDQADEAKNVAAEQTDDQHELNTRPSFGSIAMPTFDTSMQPGLLSE